MIQKSYFYLKNNIEKEKVRLLIGEVFIFILLWSGFCLLYLTQPLNDIYSYYIESSPFIIGAIAIFLSTIFLLLFIISSFCAGEIISRTRKQIEKNKLTKSQEGWILVDSLLGVIILSTAVIALLLAFTQTTKGTVASTNRTQATYLAQQALENLKAQDGGTQIIPPVIPPVDKYTIVIDSPPVSAITSDTNSLRTYLKPYRVTVSWSDISGGPVNKSIQMAGYYYVNPPI